MPTAYIVRGIPGSGKSTFAKSLGIYHIESDMFHIVDGKYSWSPRNVSKSHKWCKSCFDEALKNGIDVVVSNTFTQEWELTPYIEAAKENLYNVKIIRCTGHYDNIHNVPTETLHKMESRFENVEGEEIR